MPKGEQFTERLPHILKNLGHTHFGWTPLEPAISLDKYQNFIAENNYGEMSYLERHLPIKESPKSHWPEFNSCISIAFNYIPHPSILNLPFPHLRVALYAQGGDYHFWLKNKLLEVIDDLKSEWIDASFMAATDSFPLLERDLGYRSGLGWFGKNTMLIHPKNGSFFLLGEILTDLKLANSTSPLPDMCGTCDRCIQICPTQALSPKKLDPLKCISYWTIESRQIAPDEISMRFGDWGFGCDLCQSICPWNQKIWPHLKAETQLIQNLTSENEENLKIELRDILTSSGKSIDKRISGTALSRSGSFGMRRNSLYIIKNKKIKSLADAVQLWTQDSRLGELARQTLETLN